MTREERKETLHDLWQKAKMLFALWKAVRSGQVISMDVELRGGVLLDHDLVHFGMPHYGSNAKPLRGLIDYEPIEDDDYAVFAVTHMDGIEILQIYDNCKSEDGE